MAFSQVTKDEAWDRDNKGTKAICPACKKHEIHINTAEYDHIKSLKNGGSNDVSNCKAICATCNREKGRMDIEEYMKKFYPNEFQLNEKAIEEIKYEILEHENSIKELKIQKDILENKNKNSKNILFENTKIIDLKCEEKSFFTTKQLIIQVKKDLENKNSEFRIGKIDNVKTYVGLLNKRGMEIKIGGSEDSVTSELLCNKNTYEKVEKSKKLIENTLNVKYDSHEAGEDSYKIKVTRKTNIFHNENLTKVSKDIINLSEDYIDILQNIINL